MIRLRKALSKRRLHPSRGYTLAELIMVCSLLIILAGTAYPIAKYSTRRIKEAELRSTLRSLRYSIDEFKRYSDSGLIPVELGTDGYPAELEVLVEGIEVVGQVDKRIRFLRRVPIDPMTGEAEWGLRSYQDEPDADDWGGENVYDIYSLAGGVGLNKIPYSKW